MARILVDTNVLFPFSVMDLLLALSEDAVHTVVWSDALLDEWERVIVEEHQRTPESAASITAAIRTFFADSKIGLDDYEHLVDSMPGNDPDDRQHAAAAVAGRAAILITNNLKDFPAAPLAEHGVRVMRPDEYLLELLEAVPTEVEESLVRLASEKTNPPRSPDDLLDALSRAGVPRFADRLRTQVRRER